MAGIYIILIALILLVSYFSMTSGSFSAKPGELLSTLFRIHPNPQYDILLFQLRLPRIVMAAAIGLGLGIAGAVIQAITKTVLPIPVFWALMQEPEPESSRLCFCFRDNLKRRHLPLRWVCLSSASSED